jgi:uncharacterized protein (TIGR03382 family)
MTLPHRLLLLALALAGCALQPTDEPSQGTSRAPIVGGEVDLQHTAVFDIMLDGEQECTGTLVSPHVVLTAAHCVAEDIDDPTELVVFTGPDDADLAGGDLHEVVAGPVHPSYGTDPKDEDIGDLAVLVLAEPSAVAPMAYNRQPLADPMIGELVTVVGYGDTTVDYPTSGGGARRSLTVPLRDFDDDWVMAGGGGESQCYGDSGGPVLMELGGVERVIGVDSWGTRNNCGFLEYNTRVDLLSAWVDAQVEAHDPGFGDGDGDGDGGGDPDDGGDDADDGGDSSADSSSGGCQTSGSHGGSGALSLLLALLAALVATRPGRSGSRPRPR